ncbi:hypothetical protein R1sor_004320 [Riccia sorocarpa]|uniref:Uncharacterized protein n=1 Tax=Riccia sorocarpa TaxID=122646 RepID=A0ABD3HKF1_9MARC
MVDFIDHVLAHYDKRMAKTSSSTKYRSCCVVWAHNCHLGDARSYADSPSRNRRATKINVGQLVHDRERYDIEEIDDLGFGLILRSNSESDVLSKDEEAACNALEEALLKRFIGVQYRKYTELQSHYR